jgi:putative transposase
VKQALPGSSVRRICRLLHVARSSLEARPKRAGRSLRDFSELEGMLQVLIQEHPTYGYRRLWALLRNRLGIRANRKRIYRILKTKRWLVQ